MKNYLASLVLALFLFGLLTNCSDDSLVNQPTSENSKILGKMSIENPDEVTSSYYSKLSPPDGQVVFTTFSTTFTWTKTIPSYSGYTFDHYRITIDGHDHILDNLEDTTFATDFSWWGEYPDEGEVINWQVSAIFVRNLGEYYAVTYGFDDETEFSVQYGMPAPTISGTLSSKHPKISWDSVPNASVYIVCYKYSANSSWTFLNYTNNNYLIDDRFSAIGANGYIYYSVRAMHGPWPFWAIPSDYSNTISFYVDTNIAN